MSVHRYSIAKIGKDCVAVAKNALDDIGSGNEKIALNKLSDLQRDGSFLADAAKQLAERLEGVDKYYQHKDAEIKLKIGELNRRESEMKRQKGGEESQLAAHRSVLQDNQNRLSSEEDRLRDAERKLEEEEEKMQIGSVGNALLGLFTTGSVGPLLDIFKREEKEARDAVRRCRNDLDRARSDVNNSHRKISIVESQIRSLTDQIERMKQQCLQLQKEVDKIRSLIVFVKNSVYFWSLFKERQWILNRRSIQ